MTLDSIVAVIGLLIAAYQIMPRWRQLDLAFRFRWPDWGITAAGALCLVYLQFYGVFAAVGLTPRWGLARISLTPQLASFIVVAVSGIALWVHLRSMALSPGRIVKFSRLVEELELAREHAALFTILDRYLVRLAEIACGETAILRTRKWLFRDSHGLDREHGYADVTAILAVADGETGTVLRSPSRTLRPFWRLREIIGPRIGRLLPRHQHGQSAAREVLDRLLSSREFVAAMVDLRPYLGLRILNAKVDRHGTFLTTYLRLLLRTKSSILHRELQNNQGLWRPDQPQIPEQSPLLYALLNDAHNAENLAVYKPVGDEMLAILRELRREPTTDIHNMVMDTRFREDERWESPLFVGVHFFAIMVSQSLHQNVNWHMWLYYLRDVVDEVVTNYSPHGVDYDPEAEWPTRYSYLAYEIFSTICDWIEPILELQNSGQSNVQLERTSVAHENGNIPKSAIRALIEAHRILVAGERVEDSFKDYITEMVFSLYFKLIEGGALQYAETLVAHLKSDVVYPRLTDAYKHHLRQSYAGFDKIPHWRHKDQFEQALFGTTGSV